MKLWNEFWFAPVDLDKMKRFRILSGVYFVLFYVMVLPHWNDWFSSDGMLSGKFYPLNGLSLFNIAIFPLWVLGLVSSALFLLGFKTRIMTIILFLLQLSMIHRNPIVIGGGEFVMLPMLFYFMFASEKGEIWPLRMMQLQFCLIYWLSILGKAYGHESWMNGEFMYRFLINPMWSHFPILGIKSISSLMTWSVLVFEILFPVLIWGKKTRRTVFILAVLFHLAIAVMVKQVFFLSFAMIICLTLFYDKLEHNNFSKDDT